MSATELLAFRESTFEQTNPRDFRFVEDGRRRFFERLDRQFVLFTDYYTFDKHREVICDLKDNHHFRGIILNIDSKLFTLSQRLLVEDLSVSIIRKMATVEDPQIVGRFIHAWRHGAQHELIADFRINHRNHFYLLGCDFQLLQGNLQEFDLFKDATQQQMQNFELDEHGSYLYWKDLDFHLDINYFRGELDPEFRKRQIAKALEANKDFGKRMKAFREAKDIAQGSFEGLSDKQIRRYEGGQMYPTYKSLEVLAKRFGMTVTEYLAHLGKTDISPES